MDVERKYYTWEEVAKHNKDDDCWVVLYDNVLDVTKFLHEHKGGLDPLLDNAGTDITSSFEGVGHSSTATVFSKTMIIGKIDPNSQRTGNKVAVEPAKKWADTDREELRKYKGGGEIIPAWMLIGGALALALLLYALIM